MTGNISENSEKRVLESAIAYLAQFQEDLSAWFTIDDWHRGRWHGCRFIAHMDGRFNETRHWVAHGTDALGFPIHSAEEKYLFSAAVCMMMLLMQIVAKVKGEKTAYAMMAQKDWPICSCGMGGWFVHPLQMLKEADLLPEEGTSADCRKMFFNDLVAMRKEMSEGIDDILGANVRQELDVQVERVHDWIMCAEGATKAERKYPKEYPPWIFDPFRV